MTKLKLVPAEETESVSPQDVSPLSKELVLGAVGYAGSGCSAACRRLRLLLEDKDYRVEIIKLSELIAARFQDRSLPPREDGIKEGTSRLARAKMLQDWGDETREKHGNFAVAALAARKIIAMRGDRSPGAERIAFILDSIKHSDEVDLLRRVYGQSFRLIAVHCERPKRESRLIGGRTSNAKYRGAPHAEVRKYIERDEKDTGRRYGQQVRDAFYQADFFIDNNASSQEGENLNEDLSRFVDLVLGSGLVRPTKGERAMYHAHAAALQSSCLSRQVGATLTSPDGTILSTGTNDVPKYGGGVYDEERLPDNRCHTWKWTDGQVEFIGCHNQRKKVQLRQQISDWLADSLSADLAKIAHPAPATGIDTAERARASAESRIREFFTSNPQLMEELPGVKDLIEYSRSIHAEMSALFNAARHGTSPLGGSLYCTTYPCHNCARHLVTAGLRHVFYIEPYVKSLASELHYDSICSEIPEDGKERGMTIVPFTGVGPRMYDDFFAKRSELKNADGSYSPPQKDAPSHGVRVRALEIVEEKAASLVPEEGRDE